MAAKVSRKQDALVRFFKAIPDALDTDAEVVELQKPWDDAELAAQWATESKGRSIHGWSTKDAIAEVTACHRLRSLLATVVNEEASTFERLAAIDAILDGHLPSDHHFKRNRLTPVVLFERIRPQMGAAPMTLADVWS